MKKKKILRFLEVEELQDIFTANLPHQTTGVCGRTFTLNRLFRDGRAHGIVQNTSTKTAQSRNISYMFLLPPSISLQRVFFNCLLCFFNLDSGPLQFVCSNSEVYFVNLCLQTPVLCSSSTVILKFKGANMQRVTLYETRGFMR